MDGHRFDDLVRALVTTASRRHLLLRLTGAALGARIARPRSGVAQGCEPACDDTHCQICRDGACVSACGPNEGCVDECSDAGCTSQCRPCPEGTTLCAPICDACAPSCVDLQTDAANCGACGNVCLFADCCGGRCGSEACRPCEHCFAGRCHPCLGLCCDDTCLAGPTSQHCGACGNACGPCEECRADPEREGDLACLPCPFCCDGVCLDPVDSLNCGECGVACAPCEFCEGGPDGLHCVPCPWYCDDVCVPPDDPAELCVPEEEVCDPEREGCRFGRCCLASGQACAPADECCGGACCEGTCISLGIDPNHCGGCGNRCAIEVGERCLDGSCCPAERVFVECDERAVCPDDNLCCVAEERSRFFCCPADQLCGDLCCPDEFVCGRCAETDPATATALEDLNLRAEPSTDADILAVIPAQATVELTGERAAGFLSVVYEGAHGWAFAEFLSVRGGLCALHGLCRCRDEQVCGESCCAPGLRCATDGICRTAEGDEPGGLAGGTSLVRIRRAA